MRETDRVRFLDTLHRTLYKNVLRMNIYRNLTLAILNYTDGKVSISGQHDETLIVRAGGLVERIDTIDWGMPIALDENITDFIDRDRSVPRRWDCPLHRWHYRSDENEQCPVWMGATLGDRESTLAIICSGHQTSSDCISPQIYGWIEAVWWYQLTHPQSAKIACCFRI